MISPKLFVVLAGLVFVGCAQRPVPTHHIPPADPTRVVAGDPDYKQRRKDWFAERHRAPPGFDTKAVERANGLAATRARNALAPMAAAASNLWTERGSDNLAGRMHVAVPGPDGTKLYAGSAAGGVWRGNPDGSGWEALGDNLAGGAHWLAVVPGAQPSDPDILLAATDGGAIHRSVDDGATWTVPGGLPSASNVRRVLVPADGTHRIYMLVRWWNGSSYRNAVYRSTNRGASFIKVFAIGDYEGDLWTPRNAPGPLYTLASGGVHVSTDGGDNWALAGSFPVSSEGGELTGSEAGAPRLWAIVDASGKKLYRSDDAGQTWSLLTNVSDYWGSLNASSVDPDLFAWGGVEVHVTRNAGASFDIVNPWWAYYDNESWQLHADVPGIDVVPNGLGGETWYVSTDGGLFESIDGLNTVSNLSLSGLRVSQYYSTHTSSSNPDHVLAGAQDQGWQRSELPPAGPGSTLSFEQLISGDYGHITSSDGDHDYVYTVYPGFLMMNVGETNPALFMEDFPAGETYGWLPSVVADPADEESVFFCANHLWRYTKAVFGNSWNLSQHSPHNFQLSGGEHLTGLVFSPLNSDRVHAVSNQGRLWHSADHGLSWTQSTSTGPSAHYFYGTTMVASALDLDTVYVGGSGYGSPAVYRSTDGGVSYQGWGQGLPSTLVYGLVESPDGSGAMFCGTETGAWMRGPSDVAWIDIAQNDAPITIYWSVEAVPSEGVVRFGTYGRGIWDYAVADPCDWEAYGLAQGGANVLSLDSASATTMGQPMQFDLSFAPPGAAGYLLVSTGAASLPAKGGTLLVSQLGWLLVNVTANPAGTLELPASVPVDPNLAGLDVYLQAVMQDAGQTGGWAFSNGLTGALCL